VDALAQCSPPSLTSLAITWRLDPPNTLQQLQQQQPTGLASLSGVSTLQRLSVRELPRQQLAALAKLSRLQVLELGVAAPEVAGAAVKPLAALTQLRQLHITGTRLRAQQLAVLCRALTSLTALMALLDVMSEDAGGVCCLGSAAAGSEDGNLLGLLQQLHGLRRLDLGLPVQQYKQLAALLHLPTEDVMRL
jgi:hypothetical protein